MIFLTSLKFFPGVNESHLSCEGPSFLLLLVPSSSQGDLWRLFYLRWKFKSKKDNSSGNQLSPTEEEIPKKDRGFFCEDKIITSLCCFHHHFSQSCQQLNSGVFLRTVGWGYRQRGQKDMANKLSSFVPFCSRPERGQSPQSKRTTERLTIQSKGDTGINECQHQDLEMIERQTLISRVLLLLPSPIFALIYLFILIFGII